MVSEKQKKINNKIANRERRAAMDEAKKAEAREKDAQARRESRELMTEEQVQASQAVNTKKHMASYTALDPEILQEKNVKRAESKK